MCVCVCVLGGSLYTLDVIQCMVYVLFADHICFVVFIIFAIFAIMMLIAVIAGWWITDLVIFIIGGRGDGNGCALYADL